MSEAYSLIWIFTRDELPTFTNETDITRAMSKQGLVVQWDDLGDKKRLTISSRERYLNATWCFELGMIVANILNGKYNG
jgi:hypothetical protein